MEASEQSNKLGQNNKPTTFVGNPNATSLLGGVMFDSDDDEGLMKDLVVAPRQRRKSTRPEMKQYARKR